MEHERVAPSSVASSLLECAGLESGYAMPSTVSSLGLPLVGVVFFVLAALRPCLAGDHLYHTMQ